MAWRDALVLLGIFACRPILGTTASRSSYSVPIKIAPGSAGCTATNTLNYDSQTLGGPLGSDGR